MLRLGGEVRPSGEVRQGEALLRLGRLDSLETQASGSPKRRPTLR